jgi:hypothetical protein
MLFIQVTGLHANHPEQAWPSQFICSAAESGLIDPKSGVIGR